MERNANDSFAIPANDQFFFLYFLLVGASMVFAVFCVTYVLAAAAAASGSTADGEVARNDEGILNRTRTILSSCLSLDNKAAIS